VGELGLLLRKRLRGGQVVLIHVMVKIRLVVERVVVPEDHFLGRVKDVELGRGRRLVQNGAHLVIVQWVEVLARLDERQGPEPWSLLLHVV